MNRRFPPSFGFTEAVHFFLCICSIAFISLCSQVYFEPLKRPQAAGLADPSLVKDIFYLIPEIYSLHEKFLQQVIQRVEHWHPLQRIGDLFVNTVSHHHYKYKVPCVVLCFIRGLVLLFVTWGRKQIGLQGRCLGATDECLQAAPTSPVFAVWKRGTGSSS